MINILIEVSIFCSLGLLYYFWQKKRILRADINEIFQRIDKLTFDLNHFLNDKKNEPFYFELNKTIESLETQEDLNEINELLQSLPSFLPETLLEQRDIILKQLVLHR